MNRLVVCLFLAAAVLAQFSPDSAVVTLTVKNFKELVINSDVFWLVEFYGICVMI